MKLLTARRVGTNFRYRVHLDETKLGPDGAPDPAYVVENTWGANPRRSSETGPQFTARLTAFEANARAEMRLLCVARLAALQPGDAGTALAGEGATL